MYQIIFVDDEAWALSGLEDIFPWEEYGFHVCARCSSAEDALKEIAARRPDAVFTDIRMPRLSGIELISRVRGENAFDPAFVIISAYSDFDVARKAIDYGAIGYLLKPLVLEEVRQVALRLKARLDQKRAEKSVKLDRKDPASIRRASSILHEASAGGHCFVTVSEAPCSFSRGISSLRLDVDGVGFPVSFCASHTFEAPELPDACGCSTLHQDSLKLEEMIEEALTSFRGGFRYSPHHKVAEIQLYLGKNYETELSLAHLAKRFFLSENYLCELFKKNTGDTIFNFIRNIRLKNACRLLRESTLSIKEIASLVGFSDYNYFGRSFRQNIGQTPDSYRNGVLERR